MNLACFKQDIIQIIILNFVRKTSIRDMDSENQDVRWQQRFINYRKALVQFNIVISLSKEKELSDIEKDALIQRFEYTHELAWKVLQDFFKEKGQEKVFGSRDATRLAFSNDMIENGQVWMNMIDDRNLSSHVYHEDVADDVTAHILNLYADEFLKFEITMENLK